LSVCTVSRWSNGRQSTKRSMSGLGAGGLAEADGQHCQPQDTVRRTSYWQTDGSLRFLRPRTLEKDHRADTRYSRPILCSTLTHRVPLHHKTRKDQLTQRERATAMHVWRSKFTTMFHLDSTADDALRHIQCMNFTIIGWQSQIFSTPLSFSALVQGDSVRIYGKTLRFLKL